MSELDELLPILRCPETRVKLRPASAEELAALNERAARGALVNRGGERVDAPLGGALVRDGGDVAYPLHEGIPFLIVEEGIVIAD